MSISYSASRRHLLARRRVGDHELGVVARRAEVSLEIERDAPDRRRESAADLEEIEHQIVARGARDAGESAVASGTAEKLKRATMPLADCLAVALASTSRVVCWAAASPAIAGASASPIRSVRSGVIEPIVRMGGERARAAAESWPAGRGLTVDADRTIFVRFASVRQRGGRPQDRPPFCCPRPKLSPLCVVGSAARPVPHGVPARAPDREPAPPLRGAGARPLSLPGVRPLARDRPRLRPPRRPRRADLAGRGDRPRQPPRALRRLQPRARRPGRGVAPPPRCASVPDAAGWSKPWEDVRRAVHRRTGARA